MKVLIVEKRTNYEYLNEKQGLDNIEDDVLYNLEKRHEKHYEVRNSVIEILDKHKVEYEIIKDFDVKAQLYEDKDLLITLGGDGIFLHAVKYVNHQPVIGINTDIKNSVGFLTKHTEKSVKKILNAFFEGKHKIEKWDRISASVDGKVLPFKALNEVVIAVPTIFVTSHITLKINGKQVRARGNGIIAATSKGSHAFYKSAGGVPFKNSGIGYTLVLPYSMEGDLSCAQQVLPVDSRLKVIPNRQDHTLIFDCDEERQIKLNQESVVEIFIDGDNELNVII